MPEKDMWISTDLESIHWLKVDLGQTRTINKFVIKHAQSPVNITVDFTIQGSSDSKRWQDLVKVKDNDSNITTHDIAPSTYRYLRLYITCPALNNFYAKIYGFVAWGCKLILQEENYIMRKYLEIGMYANGFNVNNMNCVDITVAGAAGYFDYNNYFYYCLYNCIFNNWGKTENQDWLSYQNSILGKFGLNLKPIIVKDDTLLFDLIKSQIDEQNPLLMLVKYYTLFYDEFYLRDDRKHASHGIIINGYDSEKSLILTKEYSHVVNNINKLIKAYLLCDLPLTEDIVYNIWTKSNEIFKQEEPNFEPIIYTIERNGSPKIISYPALINDVLSIIDLKSDKMLETIYNYNKIYNAKNNYEFINNLRKLCINSLTILFDVFEMFLEASKFSQEEPEEYDNIKNKYLNTRSLTFNKLISNIFKEKSIDKDTQNRFIEKISSANNELFSYMQNLYKNSLIVEKNSSKLDLQPIEQAQVRDGDYSDKNLDQTKLLVVKNYPEPNRNWEVFLKFDLSKLESQNFLSARLKIYCNFIEATVPVEIYSVLDNSWSGDKITWNNKPITVKYPADLQLISAQNTWYSFDVTNLIKNKPLDDKVISICFKAQSGANTGINFFSINNNYNQPILEIISGDIPSID